MEKFVKLYDGIGEDVTDLLYEDHFNINGFYVYPNYVKNSFSKSNNDKNPCFHVLFNNNFILRINPVFAFPRSADFIVSNVVTFEIFLLNATNRAVLKDTYGKNSVKSLSVWCEELSHKAGSIEQVLKIHYSSRGRNVKEISSFTMDVHYKWSDTSSVFRIKSVTNTISDMQEIQKSFVNYFKF